MNITTIFEEAASRKASDIHLATGDSPCLRVSGEIVRLDQPRLDRASIRELLDPVVPGDTWARLKSGLPVDRSVIHGDLSFNMVAFPSADDGIAATFRILPADIPPLEQIGEGAGELMDLILEARKGLVIIAGPSISGKGTTAASLLDEINAKRCSRIFVVENNPTFSYRSKKSLITQLRVGSDFDSYERALETAHHADPDVVYVGDIPTAEALRQTIILAETGHLVIANLHAESVPDVLRRLFHAAGGDAAALHQALAQCLVCISVQRLFLRQNGKGRVPAYEWLANSATVAKALASGDLNQVIELHGVEEFSRTLDNTLDRLISNGSISDAMATSLRDRVL